jgi:hypothetical protein
MPSTMASPDLDGEWKVIRTGGLLPPFLGLVRKQIAGSRGKTLVGGIGVPFDVVGAELRYRRPFRGVVDELQPAGPGAYDGTTRLFGRLIGRFRLERGGS